MKTLEQRKESYKVLIRQLVLLGVTDVSVTNNEIIDPVAWALFRSLHNDEDLYDTVLSAIACIDENEYAMCIQNGDKEGADRLLRTGMSHHLADAVQEAIDVEIEKQNFDSIITEILEEERLDNKNRTFDMNKGQ